MLLAVVMMMKVKEEEKQKVSVTLEMNALQKNRRYRCVVPGRQDVSLSKIHIIYNKKKNNDEKHVTFHAIVNGHTKDFLPSL